MTPSQAMRTSEFDWRLASKCVVGFVALHLVYRFVFLASTGRLGSMLELYVACSASLAVALGLGLCRILGAVARRGLAIGLASAAVLALPTGLASAAGDLAFRYYLSPQLNKVPTAPRNSERGVVTQSAPGDATYRANGQAGRREMCSPGGKNGSGRKRSA
jgi:hypothetical protein